MSSGPAVALVGDADHDGQQDKAQNHAQPDVIHLHKGKNQDGNDHHDDHKAGAAARMEARHAAHVLHGQRQTGLVAENGLVLGTVIAEGALDVLHVGNRPHKDQKQDDTHHAFEQTAHKVGCPVGQHAHDEGGCDQKECDGQDGADHHGKTHQDLFQFVR